MPVSGVENTMKYKLAVFVALALFYSPLSTDASAPSTPSTPDSDISLPFTFEKVWYRPTLARKGIKVMKDKGTLTVRTDGITFVGKKGSTEITYEDILNISFGRVGSDLFNKWVQIKFRDGDSDAYALYSGGKNLGWGGVGAASRIFQSIRVALDQKGLGSVVEQN